jgi:hypothetical protein
VSGFRPDAAPCRRRRRFLDPDGKERSKMFPDRQEKAADTFLVSVENDKRRGAYLDPDAGAGELP